jgi:WD40 repeat protein
LTQIYKTIFLPGFFSIIITMSALPITSQLLGQFKPSKRFSSKHGTRITSIDFDDSGEWCVTAGDDETIQLYDCKRGKSIPVDSVDIDIPRLCIPKSTVYISLDSHIIRRMSFMRRQRKMVYH